MGIALRVFVLAVLVATQLGLAPVDDQPTPGDGIGSGYVALRGDSGRGVDDADGVRPTGRAVELAPDERRITTDHGDHAVQALLRIELPEQPQMLIIADVDTGTDLAVRSRTGGVWSDWIELVATEDEAPDGGPGAEGDRPDGTAAIGPVWMGDGTDAVEIATMSRDRSFRVETLELLATPSIGSDGPQNARAAAASSTFVRPRSHWATSGMGWASGNSGCGSGPKYAKVTGAVVHHTAGTNSYSQSQVPGIMRGIWYYHVQTQGWCDVAYNFFVDRFGQAWEARQGGITRSVIGGHTYGFNTYTTGIAQLGNFDSGGAPSAMTITTQRLVGWKLALHGIDPSGKTTYVNSASGPAKDGTPPGGTKTLSSVVGHRDLGSTSCPGADTYWRLPSMRKAARETAHTLALYRAFLGHWPSVDNAGAWARAEDAIGVTGVADELARTEAYAGVVIDELFRVALGREADSQGMQYWLDQLAEGMTVEEMSVYFYGSREYHQRSGGTNRTFIAALYRDLLHRGADEDGMNYWLTQMARGATSPVVAASFIDSIESRRDRVTRLYQRFLGRNPDPGGREYWARVLLPEDDLALARHLAVSEEFYARQYS